MYELEFQLDSEQQQQQLGAGLARALGEQPLVVYLQGDLGAGKTTLVRGFLRERGHQGAVRSPTYTLIEPYDLKGMAVYHLDLYRLCDPEELEFLGVRDLFGQAAQVFIEWPERGKNWLPVPDLLVELSILGAGRHCGLKAQTERGQACVNTLTSIGKAS